MSVQRVGTRAVTTYQAIALISFDEEAEKELRAKSECEYRYQAEQQLERLRDDVDSWRRRYREVAQKEPENFHVQLGIEKVVVTAITLRGTSFEVVSVLTPNGEIAP